MLDDLKYIHERDAQDALGVAEKQWQQLRYEFQVPSSNVQVDNIVLAGMGGSALAGLVAQNWLGFSWPFEIVRSYDIPAYVSDQTLFFAPECGEQIVADLFRCAGVVPQSEFIHLALEIVHVGKVFLPVVPPQIIATAIADGREAARVRPRVHQCSIEIKLHSTFTSGQCQVTPAIGLEETWDRDLDGPAPV